MDTTPAALLLWLTLLPEASGSSGRSVVIFSPNWRRIFSGDSITMTCDVVPPGRQDPTYVWYRGGSWFGAGKTVTIQSAKTGDRREYSCQANNTERSATARLDVIYAWVILQVPLYVYEGDDLTLKCSHYPGRYTRSTIFYKDNSVIQNRSLEAELLVVNVTSATAGTYRCEKELYIGVIYNTFYDEVSIYVQELFSTPEIKVASQPLVEGDHMTLTCDTKLSPLRAATPLQFAFYRDGREFRGFNLSDRYEIQSSKLRDSGNYSCEVWASTRKVEKRSKGLSVQVQELFKIPKLSVIPDPVVEGDNVTLTCHTRLNPLRATAELQFGFFRDGQEIQGFSIVDQHEVQSAELEDSGNYSCEVRASFGQVQKRSSVLYIRIDHFPSPNIRVTPYPVTEGDHMILTCETRLNLLIQRRPLEFAFYKDGEEVRGLDMSDQYVVKASPMDSGNYSCDVRSTANTVKKSDEVFIQIILTGSTHLISFIVRALMVALLFTSLLLIECWHKLQCQYPRPRPGFNKYDHD